MTFDFTSTADRIVELQDKVDVIEAKAKAQTEGMRSEIKELENLLQAAMTDAGLTEAKGKNSIAKVTEKLRVGIADFAALEQFVKRNSALQLFERRIALTAYRELLENRKGKAIPGLSEFKQRDISVKRAK